MGPRPPEARRLLRQARPQARTRTRAPTERWTRRPEDRDTELRRLPLDARTLLVARLSLLCLGGADSMLTLTPIPLAAYPLASLAAF